jgi:hypothetical protein
MTTTGISRPDGATKVLTESTIISYLGSPAFIEDPFPAYRFFLDYPGWPSPLGYRVFARFDDVLGILRDPDTFGQPGRGRRELPHCRSAGAHPVAQAGLARLHLSRNVSAAPVHRERGRRIA